MSTYSEYEAVPYSVVSNLMNNLTLLSSNDFGRAYGVTEQLENIKSKVADINSKLVDVDRRQEKKYVLLWLRSFKSFILAADDLFDEIATDLLIRDLKGKVSIFSAKQILYRRKIARELKETQKKVDDMVKGTYLLNLNSSQGRESALSVTPTPSNILDVGVVGRDNDKEMIIKQLMQQDGPEKLDLIAIVGMGGIGKTTLAEIVYKDERVKSFFEKQLWVCVSDCFDVNFFVKQIVEALCGDKINVEQLDFGQKVNLLHQNLKDTRYLLVLDDVWNEDCETWLKLRDCLMCGAPGSKILVTTRSLYVTSVMGGRHLYSLKGLSPEDSLALFKMIVFRNDDSLMSHALEYIASKILKKCAGHPLAIRSVAGMLCNKSESEWFSVLEHNLWDDGMYILSALRISYHHLSFQLKECFIYCCVYPKGWKIEKNELIQSWMAHGYLWCLSDEQQMEDLGNEFVNTFLNMSFLVGKFFDEYGNLVGLEMPDLIHDLACYVAGTDFYFNHSPKDIEPVHVSLSMDSYNDINLSRVRTFFLQQANVWEIAQSTIKLSDILTCKHLRLLNLSRTSFAVLPDSIEKLKSLRHLNLSWCLNLTSLPKSIGKLVMLQTLKLTGCERLEFSTEVVTRLINLRHLEIHRCKAFEDMMPAGLGKLTSLQSLSYFHVVKDEKKIAGNLNELQNLNNLRGNLEINGLDQVRNVTIESQLVNLKDKNLLESLELNWENQENIEDSFQLLENLCPHKHLKRLHVRWYPGKEFSDWLSSINHISHISLFGFNNCKSLPPLENLPCLKSLEIGSMKVLEYMYFDVVSSTAAPFFQSLARLKLSGCENFKGWKRMECEEVSLDHFSLPQFHCLSQLIINKCPKLTDLPTFPNVEELQLCESMVKPLKETLDIASSSSSTPFSMLKSLNIEGKLPDISVLPSQWKQNLTSLEHLEIGDVDNLDIWFGDNFPSLKKVVIYGCDLKALPSKMCDILSLKQIKMMGCHKLASLPEEMVKLTNLVTLEIWDCPLLVERCQSETGVDWPQVKHVSNIILRQNLRR